MYLRDPFTILKFLGGSVPIHVSMAISSFILFHMQEQLDCSGIQPANNQYVNISEFYEIKIMFWIHCFLIFQKVLIWTINSRNYFKFSSYALYTKSFLNTVSWILYLIGYLNMQFEIQNPKYYHIEIVSKFKINLKQNPDEISCMNTSPRNANIITLINLQRLLEVIVFYSQIFAMMGFLIYCKLLVWLKSRSDVNLQQSDDPLLMILSNNNNDFYHRDNFFMTISLLYITVTTVRIFYFQLKQEMEERRHETYESKINLDSRISQHTLETFEILYWGIIMYRGTHYDQIFRSRIIAFPVIAKTIETSALIIDLLGGY